MIPNEMRADCAEVRPLLSAFVDGETTPEETRVVESHLAACEECASQLAFLKAMSRSWSALPTAAPSPELFARIAAATYARPTWKQRVAAWFALPSSQWSLGGAGLIAAAIVGLLFLPHGGPIPVAPSNVTQVAQTNPEGTNPLASPASSLPAAKPGTIVAAATPNPSKPAVVGKASPPAAKPVEHIAANPVKPKGNAASRVERPAPKSAPERVAVVPKATTETTPPKLRTIATPPPNLVAINRPRPAFSAPADVTAKPASTPGVSATPVPVRSAPPTLAANIPSRHSDPEMPNPGPATKPDVPILAAAVNLRNPFKGANTMDRPSIQVAKYSKPSDAWVSAPIGNDPAEKLK